MKSTSLKKFLTNNPIQVAAAAMLMLAVLPWPYGYYKALRLVICIASSLLVWQSFRDKRNGWSVMMGMVAILFNPISPILFPRDFWTALDLTVAILFIACPSSPARDPRILA